MKQREFTSCNNCPKYQLMAKGITKMHQQYQARADTPSVTGYINGTKSALKASFSHLIKSESVF